MIVNTKNERWRFIIQSQLFIDELNKLKKYEKNRMFCKHDITHLLDTARVMYIINLEQNLKISKDIIYATGLLHDIGRAEQYKSGISHAIAGIEIAESILSITGFSCVETELILEAIRYHRHDDKRDNSILGQLLCFADKTVRLCSYCTVFQECSWGIELKGNTIQY